MADHFHHGWRIETEYGRHWTGVIYGPDGTRHGEVSADNENAVIGRAVRSIEGFRLMAVAELAAGRERRQG